MNSNVLEKNRRQGCCQKSAMELTAALSVTEIWPWIILWPQTTPGQAVGVSGRGPGSPRKGRWRWADKRLIQRNWKGSQKNKWWKLFSHWARISASLSKRLPAKATGFSPVTQQCAPALRHPSSPLCILPWRFQQSKCTHSGETSGCPAPRLIHWYSAFWAYSWERAYSFRSIGSEAAPLPQE